MNWKELADKVGGSQELSADSMAAARIMKAMGGSTKDIGNLCRRFGIEYDEDETSFQRAVKIMREVYPQMGLVDVVDVKVGDTETAIREDLLSSPGTAIVFYRVKGRPNMTAYVKGMGLMTSALGQVVIRPGARYVACQDGVELWEQEPVALVRSFSNGGE